ncbi:DNA polymerase III subunit chi [Spongorhabdus nitratireducens]
MKTSQVDFYLTPAVEQQELLMFACRLIEKAWRQDFKILVLCPDAAAVEALDELLWDWREDSFIPHTTSSDNDSVEPVLLCSDVSEQGKDYTLLLNLGNDVPSGFGEFTRIGEMVPDDDNGKNRSRENFRYYRGQGITPRVHDLKSRRAG